MNARYLLIPIALILLILYGISLLFSRLEVSSKTLHRKIWNYALLATFVTTACLGILMAFQVNYKLEVPWTEKVLKWHVNFGIAMSFVGIFHLLWHWRYYIPVRSGTGKVRRTGLVAWMEKALMGGHKGPPVLIFLIGFSGIAFQIFMIRELLGLFQGNELMLALIMFIWLLTTGTGALAGNSARAIRGSDVSRHLEKSILLILYVIILPFLSVPLMYWCKSLFFAPGIEAGPLAFSGFLLLVLTPFCFLSGFAFTHITRLFESSGLDIRKAYAWESMGSATAGLLCTAAILLGVFTAPGGRLTEKLFHPNDEILATRSGSSGRLTVTRNGDQLNIFENGILCQSSGNTLVIEEMSHFAMIQHPGPRQILVIGGLLSGIELELLKYPDVRIDLAEPDRNLFRMAERLNLIGNSGPAVRHIRKNLQAWIHRPDVSYDVILIMLPGPQNLNLNRFYTREFFQSIRKSMSSGGIISVMLPGTANYVSDDAVGAIGPVVGAMKRNFHHAVLFPGENNYLLASDSAIRTDVLSRMESRKIEALYLSEGYFDEPLFLARMEEINRIMDSEKAVNSDLKPRAYFGQINWWLGHFPRQVLIPVLLVLIILLISTVLPGSSTYSGMFIMGACAAGAEIILLFLLQISAGALYLLGGLLLSAFMAGLAAGSLPTYRGWTGRLADSRGVILVAYSAVSAAVGALALWIAGPGDLILAKTILLLILTFVSAWLTGLFFANLARANSVPGRNGNLYVFDMLGAAFGALAYPMVIIPIFGLLPALGIISVSGILILILIKGVGK
jgi:spermidine synthase